MDVGTTHRARSDFTSHTFPCVCVCDFITCVASCNHHHQDNSLDHHHRPLPASPTPTAPSSLTPETANLSSVLSHKQCAACMQHHFLRFVQVIPRISVSTVCSSYLLNPVARYPGARLRDHSPAEGHLGVSSSGLLQMKPL